MVRKKGRFLALRSNWNCFEIYRFDHDSFINIKNKLIHLKNPRACAPGFFDPKDEDK